MNSWLINNFQIGIFLWLIGTTLIYFILPKRWSLDGISLSTALFLAFASPFSLLWLLLSSLLVWFSLKYKHKNMKIYVFVVLLVSLVFLVYQYTVQDGLASLGPVVFLGISYYTCRHIHVLVEAYKGMIGAIHLRDYLHYQLFLPVLMVGPIHRYPHFQRECQRRYYSWGNAIEGLERILYGYAKAVLIGAYLLRFKADTILHIYLTPGIALNFVTSANDWLVLYAVFSGYVDVALGFSQIWGLKLEENFNCPYLAKNLIDFWQRWHITLSSWCKDYIYMPVLAYSRSAVLAIILAMMGIGVWHSLSFYYLLWGMYQALGIILCRVYQRNDFLRLIKLPAPLKNFITIGATFMWLISAKPVLAFFLTKLG